MKIQVDEKGKLTLECSAAHRELLRKAIQEYMIALEHILSGNVAASVKRGYEAEYAHLEHIFARTELKIEEEEEDTAVMDSVTSPRV